MAGSIAGTGEGKDFESEPLQMVAYVTNILVD
jgi:hypothetical protein